MSFDRLTFLRGVSRRHALDKVHLSMPRKNRAPRNSSKHFHSVADRWFEAEFGVGYRSAGIFVSSNHGYARNYAASDRHVMRIVPIGDYTYCWSPKTSDLLFLAAELAAAPEAEIFDRMRSLRYIEDGIDDAFKCGHEVMIACSQYIAIPNEMLVDQSKGDGPSILVPAHF